MKNRKQQVFDSHYDLIYVLWHVEKGLMFRSHFVRYFELMGHRMKDIDAAINELISTDLLESNTFANSHVLKLKKFAIYTLLKKDASAVSSVPFETTRIVRSAFLNERLLRILASEGAKLGAFWWLAGHFAAVSSHTAFERENHVFLQHLLRDNLFSSSPYAERELLDLELIYEYSITKQKGERIEREMQELRMRRARTSSNFSLNSFPARNIYMYLQKDEDKYLLHLDLNSSMTEKQLQNKLHLAFRYIRSLTRERIVFKANILVAGDSREVYFQSKLSHLTTNFSQSKGLNHFDIDIINLNIEKSFLEK